MHHLHWYAGRFSVCSFGWQCLSSFKKKKKNNITTKNPKPKHHHPPPPNSKSKKTSHKTYVNPTVLLACLSLSLILGTSTFLWSSSTLLMLQISQERKQLFLLLLTLLGRDFAWKALMIFAACIQLLPVLEVSFSWKCPLLWDFDSVPLTSDSCPPRLRLGVSSSLESGQYSVSSFQ